MMTVTEAIDGETTAATATAAAMTELAGPEATIEDTAAETVTVGATVTARIAATDLNDGRRACNVSCVGTYLDSNRRRINLDQNDHARPELPVHMKLLLCPS